MPEKVERALKLAAAKKGYTGERADRFVYGILRKKFGWTPSTQKHIRHKAVMMLRKKRGK